jgi:hypothetical protein
VSSAFSESGASSARFDARRRVHALVSLDSQAGKRVQHNHANFGTGTPPRAHAAIRPGKASMRRVATTTDHDLPSARGNGATRNRRKTIRWKLLAATVVNLVYWRWSQWLDDDPTTTLVDQIIAGYLPEAGLC